MPDIYTLVSNACLPGRARGGTWSDDFGTAAVLTRDIPAKAPKRDGWCWKHDPASAGKLSELWYQDGTWHDESGYFSSTSRWEFRPGHRVKVFDELEWKGVFLTGAWDDPTPGGDPWKRSAKYPGDQAMKSLPLTQEFMVGRFDVQNGSIATNALWPLSNDVDTGLVIIFAYELRFESETGRRTDAMEVVPVAPVDYKHRDFMGVPTVYGIGASGARDMRKELEASMSSAPAGTAVVSEVKLTNPRVVVALTFTGLRPKADYEPGEIVTVTRAHPHALVLASIPFHQITVPIKVKRPARSSMYTPRGTRNDEGQTEEIKSILFTDSNEVRGGVDFWMAPPAVPYWYNMFDYYRIMGEGGPEGMPRNQSFKIVRRTAKARSIEGAVSWQGALVRGEGSDGVVPIVVQKVARQGAYDNLHMSPRLVAPEALMDKYPSLRQHLQEVTMAPFCDCDCVHMHWRWGKPATKKSNKGWGSAGPHTEAGAPMVPHNQTIELITASQSEVLYRAYARDTEGMQWQVFMHHGLGLALRVGESWGGWTKKVLANVGVDLVDVTEENLEMPYDVIDAAMLKDSVFYYRLRYHTDQGGKRAVERVAVHNRQQLEEG